jgi:hypothetical protein
MEKLKGGDFSSYLLKEKGIELFCQRGMKMSVPYMVAVRALCLYIFEKLSPKRLLCEDIYG